MPNDLIFHEHEIINFSQMQDLSEEDFKGIEFVGPPDGRNSPEFLGIQKEADGLRAHYYVGTSWIKEGVPAKVLPKIPDIDFASMLGVALRVDDNSNASYFSECYGISFNDRAIDANGIANDFLVLLVMHYVSLLRKIVSSGLRRDYVTVEENMRSKVKGRILVPKNISINDMNQRPDRIYCSYQVYTEDIPENRLLKKALLATERIMLCVKSLAVNLELRQKVMRLKSSFENVSTDVYEHEVKTVKASKLYRGYKDAIHVAKMILRQQANDMDAGRGMLPPFWIDMTGLYELYVYALLDNAYPGQIKFQVPGHCKSRVDYIRTGTDEQVIIDAKYKPRYADSNRSILEDIREISGYARDDKILKVLNYIPKREDNSFIPCVIVYPDKEMLLKDDDQTDSPFDLIQQLDPKKTICDQAIAFKWFRGFYKLGIGLPLKHVKQ